MQQYTLRLIEKGIEYLPQADFKRIKRGLRGIYVLYYCPNGQRKKKKLFDVVYVGLSASGERGGIRGRLNSHRKNKGNKWTHFSAFKVWDNITNQEIAELEGLFRHFFRWDSKANSLNKQRGYRKLKKLPKLELTK